MMINAAQHHDADAVFTLQLVERLPRLAANLVPRTRPSAQKPASMARSFSSRDRPSIGPHALNI